MTAPLVIYNHIPKAAGTTLTSFVQAQYGAHRVVDILERPPAEWPSFMASLPNSVSAVVGHNRYGLHRLTSRPCRYFTMLREPRQRLLSLYAYIQRNSQHRWHAELNSGRSDPIRLLASQRNLQVQYLAGFDLPSGTTERERLEIAKQQLVESYSSFGIMERFDESLVLLCQSFGWRVRGYSRHNVAGTASPAKPMPETLLTSLLESSEQEHELYQFASDLFSQRVREQPFSFQEQVATLRPPGVIQHGWQRVRHGAAAFVRPYLEGSPRLGNSFNLQIPAPPVPE